ncbi:hypothetical protein ACFVW5_30770 [Streptomyces sp. NPDC058232]|uniref:hypothetical protein n=1 Tax=unclassified Streptomyces TaxID=2593676 RepID=UPI0036ED2951
MTRPGHEPAELHALSQALGGIVHAVQAFIDGLGVLVQCPVHGRVEQARLGGPRHTLRDGMDAGPGVARLGQELP